MAVFFFLISLTEVLLLYFLLIPVVILHSMIIVKTSDLTSLDPGFQIYNDYDYLLFDLNGFGRS